MNGLVIKSTGSSYIVRINSFDDIECRIKGNFRIRGIRSTNPITVGDNVTISIAEGEQIGWIVDVEPRKNYIIRRSTNLSKESHILAANIDQVALIVTINHPITATTFIDRYLATCEAYRVPVALIFNKIDLLTSEEQNYLSDLRALYESIGYATFGICAKEMQGDSLLPLFAGKTTLLSGNSGVGKSTLLNTLIGKEIARTGNISDVHNKGVHTTTFSEMYFLSDGAIIDTPGIKGFGGIDMKKEEVSHYFRELFQIGRNCRFDDCSHTGEPGCAVREAVEKGEIALSRYQSYLSLLGDCDEAKYR